MKRDGNPYGNQIGLWRSSYNKFTQLSLIGQYNINTNWQVLGGLTTNNYSKEFAKQYDLPDTSQSDTKAIITTKYTF